MQPNQKQVQANPMLLRSFKASSQLHNSLTRDYKRQDSNSQSRGQVFTMTGKDIVKQAQVEREIMLYQGKPNAQSEIAALSNYEAPHSREHTRQLLAKQKENRRERHIKANNEFEKWVDRLTKNIDESYKEIKKDVIGFFEDSDIKINQYYNSLDDQKLLGCEIDFLDELNRIILEHKTNRENKVANLGERLEELELERFKSLQFFCDKLQDNLNDISFILMPEVQELVVVHRNNFEALVSQRREENKEYVQSVNQRQKDTFINYEERRMQTEQRWRDLKHNLYVKQFLEDIQKISFVNPPKRVNLYQNFKQTQERIYNERLATMKQLASNEIGALTKNRVEKWIEQTKQHNERSSQQIDECFDQLVKESEQTNNLAMERYQLLYKGLMYAGAKPSEELTSLLESEYLPYVTHLNENARDLMKQAISHVEGNDLKQVDVLTNFGQFYLKLATKFDEYRTQIQQMKHNYEIEKATCADKNDENLERLTNEFNQIKKHLSEALHHPKLQACLQEAFAKLDEIEAEYRLFHEQNIQITKGHPAVITTQYEKFERSVAQLFGLVDESKRQQIEAAKQKIVDAKIKFQIAKEEYFKKIEEEKAVEEAKNKKGGKAPAPKAKDPKKAAQELEDRFKELLKTMGGVVQATQITSNMNQIYLEETTIEQIVEQFYVSQEEQEKKIESQKLLLQEQEQLQQQQQQKVDPKAAGKQAAAAVPTIELPEYLPEKDVPPEPVDVRRDPPKDPQGNSVVAKDVVFETSLLVKLIGQAKTKVFDFVKSKFEDFMEEAKGQDNDFLEQSVLQLDDKLKLHYPLKGKTEVEVYQIRFSEITQHKKRYERYAKTTLEKVDLQTDNVNYLLESALNDLKDYEKDQTALKASLQHATTLAKFQGTQNSVKENYFKFGESIFKFKLKEINEYKTKLDQLQGAELDFIAQKNVEFIKQCVGSYSQEEIDWYQDLMKELDELVVRQKEARLKKIVQIEALMQKSRQEFLDAFEKEYVLLVEELAAKDGTGKKYGRPKRLAQERLRTEMTKCEKAQDSINSKLEQLKQLHQEYKEHQNIGEYFQKMNPSMSLRLRRLLMSILTQIRRYASHIDALKPDCKLTEMPRITYSEMKFDTVLDPDQVDIDKKNIEDDLEGIGPLYYQKDGKRFSEWVSEIEKVIKDEAIKIYAGDKAKYLTGADKVPDYLRAYIDNMRKNMDDFKIQSIRDLRNACEELLELAPLVSEMMFGSIDQRFSQKLQETYLTLMDTFNLKKSQMDARKEKHQKMLKPNLSNPQNKQILEDLCENEKQRLAEWMQELEVSRTGIVQAQFGVGSEFFKSILQNFEFCLLYFDSCVLFEDFVKLPGDEQIQKKHQNLKASMRQKQSGQIVDTSSERSLTKEWEGVPLDSFNIEDLQVVYHWVPNQVAAQVDPKKKDEKKPPAAAGKKQEVEVEQVQTTTKSLKSFKTIRHKSAHHQFVSHFEGFKIKFSKQINNTNLLFKQYTERELKFEFKWEQNVASL